MIVSFGLRLAADRVREDGRHARLRFRSEDHAIILADEIQSRGRAITGRGSRVRNKSETNLTRTRDSREFTIIFARHRVKRD